MLFTIFSVITLLVLVVPTQLVMGQCVGDNSAVVQSVEFTPRDLIDDYDRKLELVRVTYVYSENPSQIRLDEVTRKKELQHINAYLKRFHLHNDNITVVITEKDGFMRVNGILNYFIVPFYSADGIKLCMEQMGNFSETNRGLCDNMLLKCRNNWEQYKQTFRGDDIISLFMLDLQQIFINFTTKTMSGINTYQMQYMDKQLIWEFERPKILRHIARYIRSHRSNCSQAACTVMVSENDQFLRINGTLNFDIIPEAVAFLRLQTCAVDKASRSGGDFNESLAEAFQHCADTTLRCVGETE